MDRYSFKVVACSLGYYIKHFYGPVIVYYMYLDSIAPKLCYAGTVRNALSVLGAHEVNISGSDTSAAAIVGQASTTTIPLGMF